MTHPLTLQKQQETVETQGAQGRLPAPSLVLQHAGFMSFRDPRTLSVPQFPHTTGCHGTPR